MKIKNAVAGLLAAALLFGGSWIARTESAEGAGFANGNESVKDVRKPPALSAGPQYSASPVRKIASTTAARVSPEVRARAAKYELLFRSAALRHGVDPRWLWIVAYLETGFRPELVSPKGARGMMQFMDATARRYNLSNPHDPQASVDAAARYLRDLSKRFGNRLDLVLAGYNAGEGAVDAYLSGRPLRLPGGRVVNPNGLKLGGIPPYAETRNYVERGVTLARLLSAPGVPVSTPAKGELSERTNPSSVFAPRQPSPPTSKPITVTAAPADHEPVIRSLRVSPLTAASDAQ